MPKITDSRTAQNQEDKDALAKRIGYHLKSLRKTMGLSIKQLALETGLSSALFSRIENGLLVPSIQTLQSIADLLKVDIGHFFEKPKEKGYVISKQGQRKIVQAQSGSQGREAYQFELLVEGMDNPFMEPVIITLPGSQAQIGLISHLGQEFTYILEGSIELTLDDQKFILKKGDSAYYNAVIPHKAISLSKTPAKALNVHLIPGKRSGTFEDIV